MYYVFIIIIIIIILVLAWWSSFSMAAYFIFPVVLMIALSCVLYIPFMSRATSEDTSEKF